LDGGVLDAPAVLDGTVGVWLAWVPAEEAAIAGLLERLDPAARERAERFVRPLDRARNAVADLVRRSVVAGLLGVDPAQVTLDRSCRHCGDPKHGKPHPVVAGEPAPLDLSTSHAGNLVAVAVAAAGTPVGVDVESAERSVDWPRLARAVFADAEWQETAAAPDPTLARWRGWTRKEAAVKASGHGLAAGLSAVRLGPEVVVDRVVAGDAAIGTSAPPTTLPGLVNQLTSHDGWLRITLGPDAGHATGFCKDVPVPAGSVGAVAVLAETPPCLVIGWEAAFPPPPGVTPDAPSAPVG
jgi:4'-phosphopantetheinyl transferase